MPPNFPVIAYHGTTVENATRIIAEGRFQLSANDYDWLGDGIYFFQDAPNRAWEWARHRHGADGVVIGSLIRRDDCLDLLDIRSNDLLVDAYTSLVEISQQAGTSLPRQ